MARLAEGSRPALGELFLRHHKRVFTLAWRTLADWNSAEDITQETFLRIWKAAPEYKPSAEFTTWLCRIVLNLCFDEKRRGRRHSVAVAEKPPAQDNRPKDPLVEEKHLWAALMKLNDRQRRAVVLHKFHGLPCRRIAENMKCTPAAVESLLVRAYRTLRAELEEHHADQTPLTHSPHTPKTPPVQNLTHRFGSPHSS